MTNEELATRYQHFASIYDPAQAAQKAKYEVREYLSKNYNPMTFQMTIDY